MGRLLYYGERNLTPEAKLPSDYTPVMRTAFVIPYVKSSGVE